MSTKNWDKEELYPSYFTEDDIEKYDYYLLEANKLNHKCPQDFLRLLIIAEINKENGRGLPLDKEKAQELKAFYNSNIKGVYETPAKDNEINLERYENI